MQSINLEHTVFIASEHPVFCLGLQWCIASEPSFSVIGEASDVLEAYNKIRLLRPEIVVLDIDMREINLIELVNKISLLEKPPKIMLVADDEKFIDLNLIFELKVNGFFYKGISSTDLLFTLNKIIEDNYVYSKVLFSSSRDGNGAEAETGVISITGSQREIIARRFKNKDANESELDVNSPLLHIMNFVNVFNRGVLAK